MHEKIKSSKSLHVPLYEGLYSKLKTSIIDGVWKEGDKLPSERNLSAQFGLCHLTVRSALAKLVKERMIQRRSGSGTVVIWNSAGNAPPSFRISSVALVLEEVDDFTSKIISKIESECHSRQTNLNLYCHRSDPQLQKRHFARASDDPDSIVILQPSAHTSDLVSDLSILKRMIIFDDYMPEIKVPQIISGDEEGMFQAVKYLADLGHTNIGHISADSKTTGINRRAGYVRAVEQLRLVADGKLIQNGSFLIESSCDACERILGSCPGVTAIACANDYAAYGAVKALKKHGLVPGQNFSLIGYGNYDISEPLGLTSVDQCIAAICEQIMYFVDEYGREGAMNPRLCRVPTELKIRNSCVRA